MRSCPSCARSCSIRASRCGSKTAARALEAGTATYDTIETDAIWPESAGSGNLYSLEFFRTCAERLRPGGLMCTWAPTPRVGPPSGRVFPHVLESDGGVILIGSEYPLQLDVPVPGRRASQAAASYLGELRARAIADRLSALTPAAGPIEGTLNRDLFPRDEFASAR